MALTVKMWNSRWRVVIDEEWEFEDLEDMQRVLNDLIKYKHFYGRLTPPK